MSVPVVVTHSRRPPSSGHSLVSSRFRTTSGRFHSVQRTRESGGRAAF